MEELPKGARAQLVRNLESVQGRIAAALAAAGRSLAEAQLVAVTKSVGPAVVRALVELGCSDLGENRPETIPERATAVRPGAARWHMIGHFQSRKVRASLPYLTRIHSVHSVELLRKLDQAALDLDRKISVLLQVNVSAEASKQGFLPSDLEAALNLAAHLRGVEVDGFMTMAPEGRPETELRTLFSSLRTLRDQWATPGLPLPELSMGMSQDFEPALKEGATLVRIGSALFADLPTGL